VKALSKRTLLSAFLIQTAMFSNIDACTGIKLVAEDGLVVHGRTLEFATKIITSFAVVPRNHSFDGTTPIGKGLAYTSRYAVVGAITFNNIAIVDGMNEKGLAAGAFYFPGYARYAEITSENQSNALAPIEFVNWILTQFANLDEVRTGLTSVVIAPALAKGFGDAPPPFHYIVYDPEGKSIVIEPLGDKFVVFDNPLGVLTNSPTFDWQMTYLRNFINLTRV
jgi:choloylglycine hydrolase